MADILQFPPPKKRPELPTVAQLALDCSEEIDGNWEKFARNNRLNDYFVQSVPSWTQPTVDYLSDLNALSLIESKIGLNIGLFGPQTIDESQIGWLANFKINGIPVGTPFMMSEAYARCFNILLFLKLRREMTTLGIEIF